MTVMRRPNRYESKAKEAEDQYGASRNPAVSVASKKHTLALTHTFEEAWQAITSHQDPPGTRAFP